MSERPSSPSGKVYLVGAGPGDPDLLTLRAARLLEEADVIVYDRLVTREILSLIPEGKKTISVGKTPGGKGTNQEEINEILRREAVGGRRVVRLKGGDPFLFGRGGEEALFLAESGVDFEVVPGVSSAIAAPAGAGIPVTHRATSRSLAVVTGHTCEGGPERLDWESISRACDTLVVLMGWGHLGEIASRIMASGRSPQEPTAAISWGATGRQRVIFSELGDIQRRVREEGLRPPLLVVVGKVVELGKRLSWREKLPLHGKRVLTLRNPRQSLSLCRRLRELGASAVNVPAIRMCKNPDPGWAETLNNLMRYQWLVFTSPNGVSYFFEELLSSGRDSRCLSGLKIAAIGPGTEKELLSHGIRADLVPPDHSTNGLARAFFPMDVRGKAFLLCRSNLALPHLADLLRLRGARVEEIRPYLVEVVQEVNPSLIDEMRRKEVDVILLTSPSTVDGLLNMTAGKPDLFERVVIGCIGPSTERRARERGLSVSFTAGKHSEEGLVQSLLEFVEVKRT